MGWIDDLAFGIIVGFHRPAGQPFQHLSYRGLIFCIWRCKYPTIANLVANQRHGVVAERGDKDLTLHAVRNRLPIRVADLKIIRPRRNPHPGISRSFRRDTAHLT